MIVITIFGHNIDNSGHSLAVFRIKGSADELQLLNSIILNFNRNTGIIRICNSDSIYHIGNFTPPAASNMNIAACNHNTGLKCYHILEFFHGKKINLFAADIGLRIGHIGLDHGSFSLNNHLIQSNHTFRQSSVCCCG